MADEAAPVEALKAAGREPWPWTDAEKADMLQSAEGMIHGAALKFRRQRTKTLSDESDYEDCAQAIRLQLWEHMGAFRPDGPAKWTTWAHHAIDFAVKRFMGERHKAVLYGQARQQYEGECESLSTCDPEYDDEAELEGQIDGDELDATGAYLTGVRRLVHADKLACLTESQRVIVEAVVFERLTLPQVADRLNRKLSIVEISFRAAVAKLHATGHVTDEQVTEHGVTLRTASKPKYLSGDERRAYEAALLTDRPGADIAAEFGVTAQRVSANRQKIRAGTYRCAKPPREPKPFEGDNIAARLAAEGRLAEWNTALESGRSAEDVGRAFGVHVGAVYSRRLRLPAGTRLPPERRPLASPIEKRLTAEGRIDAWRLALASDRLGKCVAAEFGVSRSTVSVLRQRLNATSSPHFRRPDPCPA